MKKQLLMGMVLTAVLVGQQSIAAPIRTVEAMRTEMTEKMKRSGNKDALDILRTVQVTEVRNELAKALSSILGSSSASISNALKRTIKAEGSVAGVKQVITVDVAEVAKSIAMADQTLNGPNKIIVGDLDAAGQAHHAMLQRGLKASTSFMKLADSTSDQRADISEAQKQDAAVFAQQLSLIKDLFTMNTADAQAHIEIMEKAVAKRTSPEMKGDQALAAVLREGKTEENYRLKQEEILGCIR